MRVLSYRKDGGPLSKSWGLFIIEIKSAFSVVLLRFENGTREAYHTHAFNATSWVLRGYLVEYIPLEDRHITLTHGRKVVEG